MGRHNASMPNIASILKAEISRVARKEVRAEIETLKKASVAHRASIAELRRQVNALEKELRRVAKGATRSATAPDSANEAAGGTRRRFSATRLAAHRAKLELSAASYGQLVGVSGADDLSLGTRQGTSAGSVTRKSCGSARPRCSRNCGALHRAIAQPQKCDGRIRICAPVVPEQFRMVAVGLGPFGFIDVAYSTGVDAARGFGEALAAATTIASYGRTAIMAAREAVHVITLSARAGRTNATQKIYRLARCSPGVQVVEAGSSAVPRRSQPAVRVARARAQEQPAV